MAYLLFLQNIRLALGPGVEAAVTRFSDTMLYVCFLLPFVLYWAIDREMGTFVISCYEGGRVMNGLLKVTACINRPWILDARIQPSDAAKVHATGYSFPSGHATSGTATFGSIWYCTRRRWLQVLCWVCIPLMMLARNYLGVHMAKDVLVGFGSTFVLVLLAGPIRRWIRAHNIGWGQIVVVVALICVIGGAYTLLKSYPVSDVVDPKAMQANTIEAFYECVGCVVGFWLEARFVRFSTEGTTRKARIVRAVLGLILIIASYKGLNKALGYVGYLITGLVATFVIPLVFTQLEKRMGRKA